eukprot:symbB.v1.2.004528.t1/scaffold257.1/size249567/9
MSSDHLGPLVQQLLTTSQHRVILAWEETKHRCEEAVDLLQANHVVLVQASDEGKLSVPSTFVPLEETLGRGEEMLKVLRQIEALDLPRPFVLVLLCRASSSRRLVQTLKRHLPEDVGQRANGPTGGCSGFLPSTDISLFPLPPDFRTACEEAQRFPSQCFEEARWLQMEGVHLPERCLKALDRLKPSWRDEVATSRISADVVVLTRIDRVEEGIAKSSGKASMADRELMLRQVLDRKIEDVCMRLDVPRTAVHFIENYHSGVLDLEQEVRNISVDFHALKILSQCCSHADTFIAQALQDLRPAPCAIQ